MIVSIVHVPGSKEMVRPLEELPESVMDASRVFAPKAKRVRKSAKDISDDLFMITSKRRREYIPSRLPGNNFIPFNVRAADLE